MKKIKRHLKELLSITLNTQQIAYIGREADPAFNLEEVTGFGAHIVIPRKVAADALVEYFDERDRIIHLCSVLFYLNGRGGSGGIIELRGFQPLQLALEEAGYRYDSELQRFVKSQEPRKTSDWGYLKNDEEYRLAFMSIDVAGSSELVHTNLKVDIENTMRNFHLWIRSIVEAENGRLWYWHGDGGLAAFLEEEGVSAALRSGLKILALLPVFNITQNELRYENDLRVRIGIHYGSARYTSDTARIQSEDIREAVVIEQKFGEPNTIFLSETAFLLASPETKKFFTDGGQYGQLRLYRNIRL
jgi:hypothetical protein